MDLSSRTAEKLRTLAQANVDELVISAGIFLRKGQRASRDLSGFAGSATFAPLGRSVDRVPDFPAQTLLAVGEDHLHAFAAKGGFSWKLREPLGSWDWGSFLAEREDTVICTFLHLGFGEDAVAELETSSSDPQRYQQDVVDDIVARSTAALSQT